MENKRLYSPKQIKDTLDKHGFKFSKSLGQNFLIDGNIVRKIVHESSITKDDFVLEIGPGMGTLTEELALNARRVVAMELMCVCQAIDLRGDKGLGKGTKAAYDTLRKLVAPLEEDRPLYEDINKSESIIIDESLIQNVEKEVGCLEF